MVVSIFTFMSDAATHRFRDVPAPGDELCLAFANTRYRRGRETPTETLHDAGDLLAWCEREGALDQKSARELSAWAQREPDAATRLFDAAIAARETLYRLFSRKADDNATVAPRDVTALNALLAAAPGRESLAMEKDTALWRIAPAVPEVASLLAPVIWSAGDLIAGTRSARARLCANDKCRWLFLDDSKSGTRRWCSMSSCGNRAKAHRHYMRKIGA